MPSPFKPSLVAQTLGVQQRQDIIDQPASPATVVDPRAVYDERNPIFFSTAEASGKVAAFLVGPRSRRPYTVLPGGRIAKRGEAPRLTAPHFTKQTSLGHDTNVNPTSGRHL